MEETQGDGEPRSSYPFQGEVLAEPSLPCTRGEVIAELVLGRSEERTELGLRYTWGEVIMDEQRSSHTLGGEVIGDEPCSFREKRELALISEEALTGRFSFGKSEIQGEGAERKGAGLSALLPRTTAFNAVARSENEPLPSP